MSKHAKIEAVLEESTWTWKPEHAAIPDRKFRFDYACIRKKVAIEVDGGLWAYRAGKVMGHSSGGGRLRDYEKDSLATLEGWRVFRFAPSEHKRLRLVLNRLGAM